MDSARVRHSVRGGVDYSLRQWIMGALGVGPGVGRIKILAPVDSATSSYRTTLHDLGVSYNDMYTDLATAYTELRAYQNDVLLVMPGDYTVSSEVTWAKSNTHLIGCGGPNQRMAPAAGTSGMVRFYATFDPGNTDYALFKVTGDYVQFHGFQTRYTYNDANAIADLKIIGKNFYGKGLHLRAGGGANQINALSGIPLWIDTSVAGQANCGTMEDCWIGDPHGTARTGGCGCVYFPGIAGQGTSWEFKKCRFLQTSETAAVSAVQLGAAAAAAECAERYMLFENCLFYNFSVNLLQILTQVFTDNCTTTHMILLKNSAQYGWGKWTNSGTYVFGDQPAGNGAGGKMLTMT